MIRLMHEMRVLFLNSPPAARSGTKNLRPDGTKGPSLPKPATVPGCPRASRYRATLGAAVPGRAGALPGRPGALPYRAAPGAAVPGRPGRRVAVAALSGGSRERPLLPSRSWLTPGAASRLAGAPVEPG